MAGTTKPRKPNIKASLKTAKVAETVVPICLRGDLTQAVRELEQQKLERLASTPDSLAGPPDTSDLDARITELKEQQVEHTFDFRLHELPYRQWDKLEAAHPPRNDKERLNTSTFLPALVRAAVIEPKLDDEDWDMLLGHRDQHDGECTLDVDTTNETCTCSEGILSKSQFGLLSDAAVSLSSNRDTSVPFSLLASMVRQISGQK